MAKCFYQEKDKSWTIDTKIKVNGVWKHLKRTGYQTKGEAIFDFPRVKEEFIKSRGGKLYNSEFEELVADYEKMRRVIVDQSTCESDLSTFKVHFMPYFANKSIKDVFDEYTIRTWYDNLISNDNLTNNKKSKIITRMKDLLKFAYNHKYINAEVYQDCDVNIYQVKYSKKPKTERVVWTVDEEERFLKAISKNKHDNLMFRLFLTTSPRLGEFLALQPNCFDYDKRRITICQQVKNVTGKGAILTEKLKTHESYRTIAISKELADELKEYIDTFGIKPEQFLWYSDNKNKPMGRNTIRRIFNGYCVKANVRHLNLHALRHNQAVKWASIAKTGEEIEIAAHRLGHSPSMFLNTYANHAKEEKENELLLRLA